MVQEAYCSKEVSELLKKKGFLKGIDLRLISNLSFYTYTGLQYDIAKWYDSLINAINDESEMNEQSEQSEQSEQCEQSNERLTSSEKN